MISWAAFIYYTIVDSFCHQGLLQLLSLQDLWYYENGIK